MKRLPLTRRSLLALAFVVLTAVACGESPVSPEAGSPDLFFVGPISVGELPPPTSDHDQIWVADPATGKRLSTVLVCNDASAFHTSIRVNYLLSDDNDGTDYADMSASPRMGDLVGGIDLFVGNERNRNTLIKPLRTRMLDGRVWRDVAYATVKLPKGPEANEWDPALVGTDQWYIRVIVNGWDQYSEAITMLPDASACP